MAVEVSGFEMAPAPVGTLYEKENEKFGGAAEDGRDIKFGSHEDKPVLGEGSVVSKANFPRDAIDEWPASQRVRTFYFVKYRSYDDPAMKAKIDQADKEMQRWNLAKFQIVDKLKEKRSQRADLISQLKALNMENRSYNIMMDEKKKDMEPLQEALGKLRNTNSGARGSGLCSSEEELNKLIQSLNYHIQHESITLAEEKQLLREIKQLEGTREKVIANAAMRAEIQVSVGQKEVIQDRVKLIGADLDGVRKEQQAVKAKINVIKEELDAFDAEINSLQDELSDVIQKKDKAYETIQEQRKKRDERNGCFYQNRALLNQAKELASRRDVRALEEIYHTEVEKFFNLWTGSRSFREDYENRIWSSLGIRQMSQDGRTKNADEKKLSAVGDSVVSKIDLVAKGDIKRPVKEDSKPIVQPDSAPVKKVQKETEAKMADHAATLEEHHKTGDKENTESKEPPKTPSSAYNEVDLVKLKEMKREEEIAKAKQALERKRKLAEKNAAKAAIKAQKEAEKKLKEREKKARKKAAASAPASDLDESTEVVQEDTETEKANLPVEAVVSAKEKSVKESTVRHRTRPKGPESLSKAVLKRKKSTDYWVYAAPITLAVIVMLVLGYYFIY